MVSWAYSAACRLAMHLILTIGVLVTATVTVIGQESTATIQGVVKDSTGAIVPGARVELLGLSTHLVTLRTSDNDGAFTFALVPPGRYELSAGRDGFKTAIIRELRVQLSESTHVAVILEPGSIQETINVRADAIRVMTTGAALTTAVARRLIQDLPSFTRNALDAISVAPAIDLLPGGQGNTGQVIGVDGGSVIANGSRRSQNSYYLDGAENAGAWRNSVLQFPNPDTIDELQIQTANAGVQFGKQPGAVINAITRSGTNTLRGTAFHFFHDERFNAGRWADNRAGLPKPEDNQKYSGGVIGGPIWRNRAFFFASFNAFRTNDPATQQTARFPTQALKNGDFSAVPDFVRSDGTSVPFDIKDPATGLSLGKTIPRSLMDPVALRLAELLPTAATYYDVATRQYEKTVHNDEYLIKADHVLTTGHHLTGLIMHTKGFEKDPGQAFANNSTPEWGSLERYGRQTTTSLKHRWTGRPSMFVESRFSLAESSSNIDPSDQSRDLHDLGVTFPFTARMKQLPNIFLDSAGGFRAAHANADYVGQRNHRVGATVTWVRGRQLLRVGGETQIDRVTFIGGRELRTIFRFTGRDTLNGPITSASQVPLLANNFGTQNFAYAWADFLLGRVSSFSVAGSSHAEMHYRSSYFFAEDQWRITDRLTMSGGLRYELAGEVEETYGQLGGVFVAGHRSDLYPMAPAGFAWPGDTGINPGLLPRDRDNLAPQLGLAYDISGEAKTILRAGAGLYYANLPLAVRINSGISGFGGASPTGANALLRDPFGTSKANPFDTLPQYGPHNPVPDAVNGYTPVTYPWESLFTTQPVRGVPTRIFTGPVLGYDPDLQTPMSAQWNVQIERALGSGVTVAAGYVGNRGYHQPLWHGVNAPVPGVGADTSEQSLRDRRPWPTYGTGRLYATILDTSFDSLQLWSDFRIRGLTGKASYVLSRTLSPFGINATGAGESLPNGFPEGAASAESIFDASGGAGQSSYPYDIERDRAEVGRRHVFKVHGIYDVPWRGTGGFVDHLLGRWSVSGAFHGTSGVPLNIVWGLDANADGSAFDRPNLTGEIQYPRTLVPDPSVDRRGAIQYISPLGFTGPCNNIARTGAEAFCPSVGNLPRNAVHGVGLFSLDMALLKDVRLKGQQRLQLRLEVFNVTNSNFLAAPTLDLSSPFFGQVLGRIHRQRRMQIGIKLEV